MTLIIMKVTCPLCKWNQEEAVRVGDKFCWECEKCGALIEDGKQFLFDVMLDKTHFRSYGLGKNTVRYHLKKYFYIGGISGLDEH